jgi:hypothetical protein
VFAGDDVVIVAAGGIAVTSVLSTGGGRVHLDAGGDIRVLDQILTQGGQVVFQSDADIFFSANGLIDTQMGTANIIMQAAGSIQMTDGSLVNARDGDIQLVAGGDVVLSVLQTSMHVLVQANGSILDTSDQGGVDIQAGSAELMAGGSIGSATNPLETTLGQLQATAATEGLWIDNTGNLQVESMSTGGPIQLNNFGTLLLADNVDSAGGGVAVHSTDSIGDHQWRWRYLDRYRCQPVVAVDCSDRHRTGH